ncbi:protein phosphatase 2C [Gloeomargarita lithophora Alchichica-D10]|uniref:Protein phosphatase 2C n=1 Tax=Gloeomargarita lithophora Alchichica-D10 TaxID=1188229 RepID=A0A1J0ABX7_9CYAN|nr:protein phosphatase 2C domain-containing protein [Gloeomargarita lithophora]APB33438.1 protein phosphatase 2C [Gloeomargarita lithophora Alchichica-D10]
MDKIECSNPNCYSLNPETNRFCQVCSAPLESVFLWVTGEPLVGAQFERLYQERYSLRGPNLLLDLQPGRQPLSAEGIPAEAQPYLRLFPMRLHLPQIHAVMPVGGQPRLVLTQVPLLPEEYGTSTPRWKPVQLLGKGWGEATGFRQLSWLWQIARLWPLLSYQQVAGSLLQPQLLRVEGPVFRLRELVNDGGQATLVQLGELFSRLVPTTQPVVRGLMERLCEAMSQQQITSAEELLQRVDQGMDEFRHTWNGQVNVVALTDPGPTRRRNEDACYPSPQQGLRPTGTDGLPFAIVCDGIGGHEGGDMASNLAIETVSQQLNPRVLAKVDTKVVTEELATIVCNANDRITQVNNQQQRQERQRMGTTLTMTLLRDYEVFLANVGDSRIYWITRYGCYQVTTDDDVASREVRLGYNLYPQALKQPAAGALVQALGINASSLLHPTVQRFPLDEDSVFLLCSDGLSDNNLVDHYWHLEILPILNGDVDLATANQRLIDLANQKNGHDNVTVVLVHYQVAPAKTVAGNGRPEPAVLPEEPTTKGRRGQIPATQGRRGQIPPIPPPVPPSRPSTPVKSNPRPKSLPLPLALGGLAAGLVTLGAGGWLWWQETNQRDNPLYLSTVINPAPPAFQPALVLSEFKGYVNTLAINPQGDQLAIGSEDGSISLWQLPGGQPQRFLRRTGVSVMGVTFIRNGQQIASFDRSNLELWGVNDGRRLGQLVGPKGVVTAMATNTSGRFLAVGDANGALYLWDLDTAAATPSFRQELPELGKIDALAVSPDGTLLAAASQSQQVVELWDVPSRTRKYTLTRKDFRHGMWSVSFRPDGQVLAGGGGDGKVSLWNVNTGAWLKTLKAPGIVYSLGFSPDNALLFTGTGTTSPDSPVITLWNPAKGTALQTLKNHQEAVKALAIAPKGRLLVSGGLDNQAIIWQAPE